MPTPAAAGPARHPFVGDGRLTRRRALLIAALGQHGVIVGVGRHDLGLHGPGRRAGGRIGEPPRPPTLTPYVTPRSRAARACAPARSNTSGGRVRPRTTAMTRRAITATDEPARVRRVEWPHPARHARRVADDGRETVVWRAGMAAYMMVLTEVTDPAGME